MCSHSYSVISKSSHNIVAKSFDNAIATNRKQRECVNMKYKFKVLLSDFNNCCHFYQFGDVLLQISHSNAGHEAVT